MIVFESIFEKCLHLGELCKDSRLYKNVYKVLDFLKIFHVLKVFGVFEKMFCFEDEQATKNVSTYSKVFVLFLLL